MFRRRSLLLAGILIIVLVIFDHYFFNVRFLLSGGVGEILNKLSPSASIKERLRELEIENEDLKLQIFQKEIRIGDQLKVYSSYPFNDRKEIVIAGGRDQAIKEGDIVTYEKGILIGKVVIVMEHSSIVRTIFDPDWKMAIRIGTREINGLFNGGNELTITLISEKAEINPGDFVITASRELPYGLLAGKIKEVELVPATPFKKAILEPIVNFGELKNVRLHKFSS